MTSSTPLKLSLLLTLLPQDATRTYWHLMANFGDIVHAFNAPITQLEKCVKPAVVDAIKAYQASGWDNPLGERLHHLIAWCDENAVSVLDISDEAYPYMLKSICDAPPILFVRGNVNALSLPQIAIVGSRKPTTAGQKTTIEFAKVLARSGFTITSGLALGVDTAAHVGALHSAGTTVAVMATGIDTIYPARNQTLANDIIENGGALVTEFGLGAAPKAHHFPQRNRIVSGLSCGVLVVEAALKSGSLISARFALEHDRELFAIPGSIHSPVSRGCHSLIKQGAKLVESAEEIVEDLHGFLGLHQDQLNQQNKLKNGVNQDAVLPDMAPALEALLNAIDYSPTPLDSILQNVQRPMNEVMPALLELELQELIEHIGSGYSRLR